MRKWDDNDAILRILAHLANPDADRGKVIIIKLSLWMPVMTLLMIVVNIKLKISIHPNIAES